MRRIFLSGGCHALCWVGKGLLIAFAPVAFEPYAWAVVVLASIGSFIWFVYDIRALRKWANTPFPNPADEAQRLSDEIQRRRREEFQLMTAVRVNGL